MIQTIVTPENTNFSMTVSLPDDYVGKEVHVLFFINEEVKETSASILPANKPSDFFGTLNSEEGEKIQAHLNQSRNEWERDFN